MDQGLLPRRYAKALYKFAGEQNATERAYTLMLNLIDAYQSAPAMQTTMANPFIENSTKISLLEKASGATATDTAVENLFKLLVKNRRIDLANLIALQYVKLYRTENKIYPIQVTTAAPLNPADRQRLETTINKTLPQGATAQYTFNVNPEIIGGFIVTINSQRLDASTLNELNQLRLNLLSK